MKAEGTDTTGPAFESAEVPAAGDSLVITFDEDLDDDTGRKPATTRFTVTVDGNDVTPSSFTVSGKTVTLSLGSTINRGQTVTVSYADPSSDDNTRAIQDASGNDAPSFTDESVTNNSTQGSDSTAPELSSATVDNAGAGISLVFDEDLDLPSGEFLPAAVANAFSITAGGRPLTVGAVSRTGNSKRHLELALSGNMRIYRGETVTLSYSKSTAGTDALKDDDNNEVGDITDYPVTNNSTQDPPVPGQVTNLTATEDGSTRIDLSWSAPSGSVVTGYRIEVSSDGGTSWSDLESDTGSRSTTYTHRNLTQAQMRHYRVRALNATGSGPVSSVASATTEGQVNALVDFERGLYSFAEETRSHTIAVVARYAEGVSLSGKGTVRVDVSAHPHTSRTPAATAGTDFQSLSTTVSFAESEFTLQDGIYRIRKTLTFTLYDDDDAEGPEYVELRLAKASTSAEAEVCTRVACPATVEVAEAEIPADRIGMTIEAVRSSVTEGQPAQFRIRVLKPVGEWVWTDVKLRAFETGRMLHSNPGATRRVSGETQREIIWSLNTHDDGWPEDASEITAAILAEGKVHPVGGNATIRVRDNDQAVRRAPGVPERFEAIAGDGRTTLSWEPPYSDGGAPITRYEYQIGQAKDPWVRMGGARSTYTLQRSQTDNVRIRAVNAEGAGEATRFRSTSPENDSVPGMPRDVWAIADGNGGIELRWSAPAAEGTSAITGYAYIVEDRGKGALWQTHTSHLADHAWVPTGSTARRITITRRDGSSPDAGEWLEDGKAYAVAVRAMNAKGAGYISKRVAVTVTGTAPGYTDTETLLVPLQQLAPENESDTEGLTASLESKPDRHDGSSQFTVRIRFSEALKNGALGAKVVRVTGGANSGSTRVAGDDELWDITITPSGDGDVTLWMVASETCGSGIACTSGDERPLSADWSITVPGPEQPQQMPLTARFTQAPAEHDGSSAFKVRITFSETLKNGALGAKVVRVTGGTNSGSTRIAGTGEVWEITVTPAGNDEIQIELASSETCGSGIACTVDLRPLSVGTAMIIRGPAGISVDDASGSESDGHIDFTVRLSRRPTATVTVDYVTAAVSAAEGEDYTKTSGTLTFTSGEQTRTVRVPVLTDAADEDPETFNLVLSNASGAYIADATGVGTITNSGPLQEAWLARFGRTVGNQAVDAVGARLAGGGGTQATLGGAAIGGHAPGEGDLQAATAAKADAAMSAWLRGEDADVPEARSLTGRELLLGSSFHLAAGGDGGVPAMAAWGRVSADAFDADVDGLELDGDVTTAFVGADLAAGRWLGGVALGHSEGESTFRSAGDDTSAALAGTVGSTLTALYPYVRYAATERLDVWAMAGLGQGSMTVDEDGITPRETDIAMRMGVVGATGALLQPGPGGGLALALRSDALVVQLDSDAVRALAAAGGHLAAATADVSRVRVIVEASRAFALDGGATLTPALEAGLRHDAGDAETGTGVELGARVRYAGHGVALEGAVRGLVAHEATDYEEWGASAALRIDPGADGRGLKLTVAPTWGTTGSAADRLWQSRDAHGLAPDAGFRAGRRLEAEVGYGFGLARNLGGLTPFAGLSLADGGEQVVRGGAHWTLGSAMTVRLEGSHRAASAADAAEQRLGLTAQARW